MFLCEQVTNGTLSPSSMLQLFLLTMKYLHVQKLTKQLQILKNTVNLGMDYNSSIKRIKVRE